MAIHEIRRASAASVRRSFAWRSTVARRRVLPGFLPLSVAIGLGLLAALILTSALALSGSFTPSSSHPAVHASSIIPLTAVDSQQATNNQSLGENAMTQSSSSQNVAANNQVHAEMNVNNGVTTTTINGDTRVSPPNQAVDRSVTIQNNGTTTQVHMQSQSTSTGTNGGSAASQQTNLTINSSSKSSASP